MIIKNEGKRKEKKRRKYYEAVEELEVDDRVAAVEAGRLTEGVDEKVAEGVDERIEQFVGGCIPVVPLINSIISSQKNSLVIEMLTNYDIK